MIRSLRHALPWGLAPGVTIIREACQMVNKLNGINMLIPISED